jgi:cytochrome b561
MIAVRNNFMENKNYSLIYRTIHWLIAISFVLLMITIFLRMYWMNKTHVSDIIADFLKDKSFSLTEEERILLAKKIRKPMWQWHIYIGYFLVGIFSLRMVLPLFGIMPLPNPMQQKISQVVKIQKWVYLLFYLCVSISLVTGLLIEFGPKEWKSSVENIHELSIYYLLTYIALHLAGILYADFVSDKGIISRMIGGGNK